MLELRKFKLNDQICKVTYENKEYFTKNNENINGITFYEDESPINQKQFYLILNTYGNGIKNVDNPN